MNKPGVWIEMTTKYAYTHPSGETVTFDTQEDLKRSLEEDLDRVRSRLAHNQKALERLEEAVRQLNELPKDRV